MRWDEIFFQTSPKSSVFDIVYHNPRILFFVGTTHSWTAKGLGGKSGQSSSAILKSSALQQGKNIISVILCLAPGSILIICVDWFMLLLQISKQNELDYRDRGRAGLRIQSSVKNFQLTLEV